MSRALWLQWPHVSSTGRHTQGTLNCENCRHFTLHLEFFCWFSNCEDPWQKLKCEQQSKRQLTFQMLLTQVFRKVRALSLIVCFAAACCTSQKPARCRRGDASSTSKRHLQLGKAFSVSQTRNDFWGADTALTILACSAGVVLRLVIAMKPHALIPAAWHEISLSVTPAEHAIAS